MHEISPVLAGSFDQPNTSAVAVNFNVSSAADTPSPAMTVSDSQRYSKFDHSASQTADATMSFGDVLDMLNPLQHIPVVSSIYRSVTGDTINPVARVAGNILYGAALGPMGAVAGGIGAIADSTMEAKTGNDMVGSVYASLFGDDKAAAGDASTEIAAATTTATSPAVQQVAANQPPAVTGGQGYPLARNKMPYGGVMAPVKSMQEQNMAIAMASATGGLRIGNTLYPERMIHGVRTLPPSVPAAASPSAFAPSTTGQQPALITALPSEQTAALMSLPSTALPATPVPAGLNAAAPEVSVATSPSQMAAVKSAVPANSVTQDNSIPSGLSDDALIMRALGVYQGVASGSMSGTRTLN